MIINLRDALPPVNPAGFWTPGFFGIMVESIFTGINLTLCYGFLTSNKADSKLFRALVVLVAAIDLIGTTVTTFQVETAVIGGYVNPANLIALPKYFFVDKLGNWLETALGQGIIARQIFLINKKWWPASAAMGILILTEIGIGLYITESAARFTSLPEIGTGVFAVVAGVFNIIAAACDILATISLCTLLHSSRTGLKRTDSLINSILRDFIGRGVLLAVVQIIFIGLWYTENAKLYWFPLYLITGKLYLTTLLSLLNLRGKARATTYTDNTVETHISWRQKSGSGANSSLQRGADPTDSTVNPGSMQLSSTGSRNAKKGEHIYFGSGHTSSRDNIQDSVALDTFNKPKDIVPSESYYRYNEAHV